MGGLRSSTRTGQAQEGWCLLEMLRVLAFLECSLGLLLPSCVSAISECTHTVRRASLVGDVSWLRAGGCLLEN